MKQLYSLFLVFSVSYVLNAQFHDFQLVLVNSNVGSELNEGCSGCGYESNDEGLNSIFQNHNVDYYQHASIYSGSNEELLTSTHIGSCNGCNVDQLVQDLNDYDGVVLVASSNTNEDANFFNHGLSLNLVDELIGIPIGEINGIITTNNASLNQIFIDFNVSYYELTSAGTSYERFELFCNCDATSLKQELDLLSTIVSSTEYLEIGVVLSTEEDIKTKTSIHPNPFSDAVSIEANKPIERVTLYDILGKSIYVSSSISDFESFSSTLKSGVYLLKLFTNNGESLTRKLIKS